MVAKRGAPKKGEHSMTSSALPKREPNKILRNLRKNRRSMARPNEELGRPELADLVNRELAAMKIENQDIDGNYVGKLEQGIIGCPREEVRREAFRRALKVPRDEDLGFFPYRRSAISGPSKEPTDEIGPDSSEETVENGSGLPAKFAAEAGRRLTRGQRVGISAPNPDRTDDVGIWNVMPPARGFRGRQAEIDAISVALKAGQCDGPSIATVHGIAGIGKTQLARAYADHHKDDYSLGWWISAETNLELTVGMAHLAERLGAGANISASEVGPFLARAMDRHHSWLIVLDNAHSAIDVEPLVSAVSAGSNAGKNPRHVLVTSRSASWAHIATPIAVDVLDLESATSLLTDGDTEADRTAARDLATELGQLPLAIGQAAAYSAEANIPPQEYLRLFRRERARLLTRGTAMAYPGNVSIAVSLALERLGSASPEALALLEICALFSPDPIPIVALLSQLSRTRADIGPLVQLDIRRALRGSGLLAIESNDYGRMHRLTRLIIEDRTGDHRVRLDEAVEIIGGAFPETPSEPDTWKSCGELLPHTLSVLDHARREGVANATVASILTRAGRYLLCSGLSFDRARELHEEALRIRQKIHAGDHPEVARCIVHLAVDLNELGDTGTAVDLHRTALEMRQRIYDGDHSDVAHSLDNLGNVLHISGDYEGARKSHQLGLEMRSRIHPGNHPNTAYSLSNLAGDLHKLGNVHQALEMNESALAMRRALTPGDHPDTAHSLSNLASDLRALGRHQRALELETQSLQMRQRMYPSGHPNIVKSLLGIAADYDALSQDSKADESRRIANRLDDLLRGPDIAA